MNTQKMCIHKQKKCDAPSFHKSTNNEQCKVEKNTDKEITVGFKGVDQLLELELSTI